MPEVGSIQDRLQKYSTVSSFPTPANKVPEPENAENQPIKIGKLSDRKSSYLKQFEQREDSSPSKLVSIICSPKNYFKIIIFRKQKRHLVD